MHKFVLPIVLAFIFIHSLAGQQDFYKNYSFTKSDTLRGMLRPERTCFDVTYYDLNIEVDIEKKCISGYNDIYFDVKNDFSTLQIDLFENMSIDKIIYDEQEVLFDRKHQAVFVHLPMQKKESQSFLRVYYEGSPVVAKMPPWDGGFVWSKDEKNKPWIGVACEGDGASLWWPNKDHLSDEPDSMAINITIPNNLFCVANGNLRQTIPLENDRSRYEWFVSYPINNYNVTLNIAEYAHFQDTYIAADGDSLALDYYVLSYNKEKAEKHFKQVHNVLASYEHFFGKYPFWNDGFALVETPYLGMEHQSAVAYGNRYQRGYLGGMIPKDMDWDYIIVHETGHEYWGNSISCNDLSEMWIHESFTTYMEALYVEYSYSYEDAIRYLKSQRPFIKNKEPVLGPKHVNWEDWDGSDHYYKGAWILHTLRHAVNNDELWWDILKSFYQKHAISNINTDDFAQYVNQCTNFDFSSFFEQYLTYPNIPTFIYKFNKKGKEIELQYRWEADVDNFNMPVLVKFGEQSVQLFPSTNWQSISMKSKIKDFKILDDLFYIDTLRVWK